MTHQHSKAVFDRRQILRGAAILGAGAAAAACAGPGTVRGGSRGPASQASAPAPIGTAKVSGDLSFAHWRAEDKAVFDKIIGDFAKANPGATVRQDISPSNDYQSTALQKIKGGAIGDAFTAFRGAQFVDMAKAGLFLDLSAQTFADGYLPKMARGGKDVNGRQLGLPYQLVFNMPIFNVDLFEKAGVSETPRDWDGFLDLCERLKGRGVVPLAWPGGEPANAGQLFNSMVMNNQPSDTSCADIESGKATSRTTGSSPRSGSTPSCGPTSSRMPPAPPPSPSSRCSPRARPRCSPRAPSTCPRSASWGRSSRST